MTIVSAFGEEWTPIDAHLFGPEGPRVLAYLTAVWNWTRSDWDSAWVAGKVAGGFDDWRRAKAEASDLASRNGRAEAARFAVDIAGWPTGNLAEWASDADPARAGALALTAFDLMETARFRRLFDPVYWVLIQDPTYELVTRLVDQRPFSE
ncbi:hypothetical protein [Microbacterium sp. cf046]|uniref:hypothetical protein n=1 Tax=Microbacterium sp. cf046 TaxID=1761803 RepID=UPI00111407A7|nr:hypothetical protein [Microbacterium sp. cf046]